MAEKRVVIEGMFPGATYPGGTTNPLPVLISSNPQVDGTYIASIANVVGTVVSNTFMTLYNPVGSGKNTIVAAAFVSTVAAAGTGITVPLRIHRFSGVPTGGSVMAASAIFKFDTVNADPVTEVRTNNPTVTLLAAASNTPPPVTTGVGGGQFVHELDPPAPAVVLLRPGEGVALNTATGDTAQRWNISLAWAEV